MGKGDLLCCDAPDVLPASILLPLLGCFICSRRGAHTRDPRLLILSNASRGRSLLVKSVQKLGVEGRTPCDLENQIGVGGLQGEWENTISIGALKKFRQTTISVGCSAHSLFIYYLFWPNMFTELEQDCLDKYPVSKIPSQKPPFSLI